jgi:hypothetical protein
MAVVPRIPKPKVRGFGNDFGYLRTDEDVRAFLVAAHEEDARVFAKATGTRLKITLEPTARSKKERGKHAA